MKYDFDEIVPRRGTHSVKWELDSDPDILPMWVADMDFRTAPPVVEALRRRVEHGIFGYAQAPQAYYDAVVKWFERRHGWHTEPEWILHTTGVIPALSAILKALTQPGDKILVQTPVYNHFFISIRNSGCRTAENDLTYRGGAYTIDFADLERKAADPEVKAMLLCNPHNPAGRVWSPEELRRIGEICLRNGIFVVADEIHCELVMPGFRYTPFASLGEEFLHNSVTCCSPSKAFNLAGLQVANIIAAGETVRAKIEKALRINETGEIGPLAIDALIAAYDRGAEWLDALNEYLHANYLFLREYFAQHLPQYPVLPLEGTYLVWADCRAAGLASDELAERLLAEGRLRDVRCGGRRLHPAEYRLPAHAARRRTRTAAEGARIAEIAKRRYGDICDDNRQRVKTCHSRRVSLPKLKTERLWDGQEKTSTTSISKTCADSRCLSQVTPMY